MAKPSHQHESFIAMLVLERGSHECGLPRLVCAEHARRRWRAEGRWDETLLPVGQGLGHCDWDCDGEAIPPAAEFSRLRTAAARGAG